MADVVLVDNVSKRYRRYHPGRPTTLQELLVQRLGRMRPVEEFWGLRDVSFAVSAGTTVGVIGTNGSGKSTLLRLIGGVGRPDRGTVTVRGRIGALLDLGAGFHPDLTGRENVIATGVMSGLTRRDVLARFDAIVSFAELEPFIDNPLRTYSTGMQMRLAFAVAVHAEPEIILIDEVLSVGDLAFQRKCLDRIARFKRDGYSILVVSHEASLIRDLCDSALWLREGRLVEYGEANVVVNRYVSGIVGECESLTDEESCEPRLLANTAPTMIQTSLGTKLVLNENRFGSMELEIVAVRLKGAHGELVAEMMAGDPLSIEIDYVATQGVVAPIFQVYISRQDGLACYNMTTANIGELDLAVIRGEGRITLHVARLDLNTGTYYVDVGCYAQGWAYALDYHANVYPIVVHASGAKDAAFDAPHQWELRGSQRA